MGLLNDHQARHLGPTFQHIDGLLASALPALDAPDPPSPFQVYVPDATPVQKKVLEDFPGRSDP